MEDGDDDGKIMDTWTTLDDQRYKDSTIEDLMRDVNTTSSYNDGIEENNEERFNSVINEAPTHKSAGSTAKIIFKGFKKRILAQAQENQTVTSRSIAQEQQLLQSNVPTRGTKDKKSETKRGKITEYAQYLGLQPASKYKCLKCHSSTSFCSMSMLKQHQRTCSNAMAPMQGVLGTSESSSLPLASNFKITRKVYLCSACGTYFENWNLFLHMREVHKRHICLFCLGMFGQAERLSYHLSSKHSVPEMTFSSVEDFYNSFKGSCYLICCSCEKVFSEMDNFYNHFCSTSQKQQSATKVCSLCKQMGSHSANCSLVSERNKAISTSLQMPGSPQQDASAACVSAQPMIGNNKGISRRIVRNNRLRHGEESVGNFHHQKLSDVHSKKINIRSQSMVRQGSIDVVSNMTKRKDAEMLMGSVRDTVAETIMEVSRYTGDSDSNEIEGEGREIDGIWHEEISKDISPVHSVKDNPYDTVTQTIMEVSRCTTDMEDEVVEERESSFVTALDNEIIKVSGDVSVEKNASVQGNIDVHESVSILDNTNVPENIHSSTEELTANKEIDERLNPSSPMEQESDKEKTKNEEVQTPKETRTDSGIQVFDSSVGSSAVRSLFSPQHESQISNVHPKEQCLDKSTEEQQSVVPSESQTSVSFNTVTTSDRSLVIKICTNKNSQFSVTSANANVNNSENHDTSRESEENNNREGSTSEEKASNLSERERESISSCQDNDGDSDSDSDKLAVVDNNIEEGETEAEFGAKAVSDGEAVSEAEAASEAEAVSEAEAASEVEADAEVNVEAESEERKEEETEEQKKEEETEEPNQNEPDGQGKENNLTVDETKDIVEENQSETDDIVVANEDVPSIDLNVEGILDTMEIEELLKRCISAASITCVYCNHARQIAVNGKQLGLHMLAEHRFQPQHPAIIIHREQFIARVKKSLHELESRYFNLDSYDSTNGTYNISNIRTYECFHCRFHSVVHKELYLHNRKMHQKTILICIMCKSTFYSYSELLCHLCSGVYSPNVNVRYRCCLCPTSSLPSAFRLMVHLRKRHHACDVCLESTGNQQRLSNHVWKHKLHHLCYRCGIAYRNKPDITKHLFWKHGTESVLCKKCLQKKWPHIYHFCIPPTAFVCEECGSSFSHAVALRVHKRLHSGDLPYSCGKCNERFISKKLLCRHENNHKELRPVDVKIPDNANNQPYVDEKLDKDKATVSNTAVDSLEFTKEPKESVKKVVDVYDLPPLNLSSESDSDTADEKDEPTKQAEKTEIDKPESKIEDEVVLSAKTNTAVEPNDSIVEVVQNEEEKKQEAQIMDGIWDNFKSYTASLEIQDSISILPKDNESDIELLRDAVLFDHDYCLPTSAKYKAAPVGEDSSLNVDDKVALGAEHDYTSKPPKSPSVNSTVQNVACENDTNKKKIKTSKKKKQTRSTSSSDSSTDSDSSSCSCGPNCSCSSSSSGSSSSSTSSSDSDSSASENSPHKQSSHKERRKERDSSRKNKPDSPEPESKEVASQIENGAISAQACNSICPTTMLLRESDLETEETETDEDFYDEHPQQLANKLLAEKRNQLMLLAAVAPASTEPSVTAPLNNGAIDVNTLNHSPDPIVASVDNVPQIKKKVKTKKRKKSDRGKQRSGTPTVESIKLNIPKSFYQNKLGLASSSPAVITVVPSRASTPNFTTSLDEVGIVNSRTESQTTRSTSQNVGSGSENENKRSSKRKRVPKRFYGDSSDEEGEKQPPLKWRKVEAPTFLSTLKPLPPQLPFMKETVTYRPSTEQLGTLNVVASASESEGLPDSSSDSSDTEPELNQPAAHLPETSAPVPERSDNLYCYCQCPYDEVSEMIACDGEDCHIEWFHFECVGIMVPPKGKWYCPDCRKKYGILQSNEDYFD